MIKKRVRFPGILYQGDFRTTLKKILVREDQYLYVARRTFRNLFLRVIYLGNEARSFKNEMLPEKADISLLKISICISVSAIGWVTKLGGWVNKLGEWVAKLGEWCLS
jgi:hypothetical protein